jgi:hypothetical protein
MLIEFEVPMKLVQLIKMCLNETYGNVCIGKHLSDSFRIQNDLIQAIRKVHENQVRLKLNGAHKLLSYADDMNQLGDNVETIQTHTQTLTEASKEVGPEVNLEKTKYMLVPCHQNAVQNQDIKI